MLSSLFSSQTFCWSAFLLGSLLVGSMLGVLCVSIPKTLRLPLSVRFFLGFSCTPYIIGVYTLILSLIPNRLPNMVYILPLYGIAVGVLFWKRKMILKLLPRALFARFNFEQRVILAGLSSYFFSEALVRGMSDAGVKIIVEHRIAATSACAAAVFGILLFFITLPVKSKTLYKKMLLLLLLTGIYSISCYAVLLEQAWMRGGYTALGFERVSKIFLVFFAFGIILFLVLTFFTQNKEKFSARYNMRVSLSYLAITLALVSTKRVQNIIGNWVKTAGISEPIDKMFYESFIYVALILGIICIVYYLYSIDDDNKLLSKAKKIEISSSILQMLVAIISILALSRFLYMITDASFAPVIGADANQYMSEALTFAKEMQFSSMNSYNGSPDGALIANIHHPSWSAYLANALLHTQNEELGFPNDLALRLAFQMTYVYLLAAIWAFGRMISRKIAPVISIFLIFLYDGMLYTYTSASRDAYRLIAVLALGIVLFAMESKLGKEKKFDWKYALVLFGVCSFVMMGHPINAITAIAVVVSFTGLMLIRKKITLNMLKYYMVAAAGALVGSYQMIQAFFETGKMTGTLIDMDKLLLGSDYYQNYIEYTEGRLQGTTTYLERIAAILERDSGLLSIVGLVCTILLLIVCFKERGRKKGIYFLSFIVIFNSLFLTDLFGWSGLTLTKWCVMNPRYTFQFYIFWSLEITCAIGFLLHSIRRRSMKIFTLISAIVIAYIFLPCVSLKNNYGTRNLAAIHTKYVSNYTINKNVQETLGENRVLVDNFYMNYYLDNQGLSFFTEPAKQIRMAQTEKELYEEMQEQEIGAVLLTKSYDGVYWNDTLMEEFVHSDYIKESIETGINVMYILK